MPNGAGRATEPSAAGAAAAAAAAPAGRPAAPGAGLPSPTAGRPAAPGAGPAGPGPPAAAWGEPPGDSDDLADAQAGAEALSGVREVDPEALLLDSRGGTAAAAPNLAGWASSIACPRTGEGAAGTRRDALAAGPWHWLQNVLRRSPEAALGPTRRAQ